MFSYTRGSMSRMEPLRSIGNNNENRSPRGRGRSMARKGYQPLHVFRYRWGALGGPIFNRNDVSVPDSSDESTYDSDEPQTTQTSDMSQEPQRNTNSNPQAQSEIGAGGAQSVVNTDTMNRALSMDVVSDMGEVLGNGVQSNISLATYTEDKNLMANLIRLQRVEGHFLMTSELCDILKKNHYLMIESANSLGFTDTDWATALAINFMNKKIEQNPVNYRWLQSKMNAQNWLKSRPLLALAAAQDIME